MQHAEVYAGRTGACGRDLSGLDPVVETMLIALWARAAETARPDAIVRDPVAARLAGRLDYDFARFRGAWKTQVGVAVRTRRLDTVVTEFLERHPGATVVNLGAGLDTRHDRVDDGRRRWLDVDVPEAIALRRRLVGDGPRHTLHAGCALDPTWIDRARGLGPGPVFVVAEGTLMFLPELEVREMVARVAAAFPGGGMAFDLVGPLMIRFPWLHDTLPRVRTGFRWGLARPSTVAGWSDDIARLRLHPMLDECPARWRWMRCLRRVPPMRRQFVVAELTFAGHDVDRSAVHSLR